MKAKDLTLQEIVQFGDGLVHLHERRLVLHDMRTFAQFRKDLFDSLGPASARRLLTRFGFMWGQADAAAMRRLFTWSDPLELLRAGPRLQTLQGVAQTRVKELAWSQETGLFHMEVAWHRSGEAEEHLTELGPSPHPVCWMLTGYASGFASFVLERDIFFIERKCLAQGDRLCVAVGHDAASWGPELAEHRPFFQAEGIHGKIVALTQELKKKERELARNRKKLDWLQTSPQSLPVEVHSQEYARVLEAAARVAAFDTSVLITGESGVGKEVLARHIHKRSPRSGGLFVTINCSALPETLLEGELFGYKAGAFTGAARDRKGLLEEANEGTLLLDEIGDVPLSMQVKLLRMLQEREIVRLGENKPRKINVRVIAATHRNLKELVREQKFREDLYYRLGVVELEIPPLRRRPEDILPMSRYFVEQMARKLNIPNLRLDATCLEHLRAYAWPGNVRELENAIERAAIYSREGLILPEHLPPAVLRATTSAGGEETVSIETSLAEMEARHIERVLASVQGNQSRAARILGISPSTLWRKLRKH